ncbi:MAG: hypothetical protein COU22_02390 [Candidatus Komeilibacteria bacterium CG10_big_fil_rev_8_21_14_0_10_41_13]|uniref:Uncharacterized protein n=1 Tax=Candidatus Komeilibacteria bacterium CG10_big_fil_rev_8_21_14_0_10_41_13 TaxID=1974476 RepID=A0A2M6WC74_9BACT|nr:MAG: hypothetical protein COU22_02390 [Candidatus Komeilibacteria bacterium CG10_big_fil_rev_8_21_14_0_10_41_13]
MIKKRAIISLTVLVVIVTSTYYFIRSAEITEGYEYYNNKFIIQNSAGDEIFSLQDNGSASRGGENISWDVNSASLPAAQKPVGWNEGFEIRDPDGNEIIFYIEENAGQTVVHLAGDIIENLGNSIQQNPLGFNVIFQNSDGENFAYLNSVGSLYLRGDALGF